MISFVLRRVLVGLVVLLIVSYVSFVFFTTKFGVLATAFARGPAQASSMWWHWLGQLVRGNLSSLGTDEAWTWTAFRHTGALLGLSAVLVLLFALAVGVVCAARAGSSVDLLLRALAYVSWGIPPFVLALVLWKATGLQGWPGECATFGQLCQPGQGPSHAGTGAVLKHLALPAMALAASFIGLHARYLRSALIVALSAPYTTTARAKGLNERRVVFVHALRNSLATFASALLLDFGAIFGAALAVDYVFRLDGVGMLFLYEISAFSEFGAVHFYSVSLLLTLTAALVLLSSVTAEVVVALLDPRTRTR
jgi:peptide/nickel transport system permease protein